MRNLSISFVILLATATIAEAQLTTHLCEDHEVTENEEPHNCNIFNSFNRPCVNIYHAPLISCSPAALAANPPEDCTRQWGIRDCTGAEKVACGAPGAPCDDTCKVAWLFCGDNQEKKCSAEITSNGAVTSADTGIECFDETQGLTTDSCVD